ncbi:hypothetical protein EMCRGX_G019075, partial [Ephydatia muelleri]
KEVWCFITARSKMGNVKSAPALADPIPHHDSYSQDHPTLLVVRQKVKRKYPEYTDEAVNQLADLLMNPEAIKAKYFGHIVERITRCRSDASEDANDLARSEQFRNIREKDATRDRLDYERRCIAGVNVKLLWIELEQNAAVQFGANLICPRLNKNTFTYGPFHVALLVDDVVVEWSNTSLVIPYRSKDPRPIIAANIGEPTELSGPIEASLRNPALLRSFLSEAKEIVSTAENKIQLIDQLCAIIARYNKKQSYNIFSNNCQHFANDVLMYIGMEKDAEMFKGRSKDLADAVMAGFGKEVLDKHSEFNSHEELNRYVTDSGEGLSREELEFCQLHYLLFHAWSTKCPEKDEWKCNEEECKLGLVEDRLRGIPS